MIETEILNQDKEILLMSIINLTICDIGLY